MALIRCRNLFWIMLCTLLLFVVNPDGFSYGISLGRGHAVTVATNTSVRTMQRPNRWTLHQTTNGQEDGGSGSNSDRLKNADANRLRKELNAVVGEDADEPILSFTASNFDESLIPVPVFTAVVILLGSLYVTAYGIYVGINGFPVDESLPRIF